MTRWRMQANRPAVSQDTAFQEGGVNLDCSCLALLDMRLPCLHAAGCTITLTKRPLLVVWWAMHDRTLRGAESYLLRAERSDHLRVGFCTASCWNARLAMGQP